MIFYNKEHRNFYYDSLEKCHIHDTYHLALFYVLGVDHAWHTSGLYQSTLLAFNLFNGFVNEEIQIDSTPYHLFASEYGAFFIEAVKLRYPEHTKVKNNNFMEKLRWSKI